jgi:hypothetical protein
MKEMNMPDVYHGKTPEQRLRDRLRNSGDDKSWPAAHTVETQPTRTFTNVHRTGATQQNATVSGQPKGSHPEAAGIGTFFSSSDEDFARTYSVGKRGR